MGACFRGQSFGFDVTELNSCSPALDCSFVFTITGLDGHCFYESQPKLIAFEAVVQYDFGWVYPPFACTLCGGGWHGPGLSWLLMTRHG